MDRTRIQDTSDPLRGVERVRESAAGWRNEIFSLRDGVERVCQALRGGKSDHGLPRQGVVGIGVAARAVDDFSALARRIIGQRDARPVGVFPADRLAGRVDRIRCPLGSSIDATASPAVRSNDHSAILR